MKKILVPVDFSGHTEIACNYALEIADKEGAVIRLFHTYSDQFIIADSSFPDAIDMSTMYNEELLKEIFHQSEKKMEALRAQLEEKVSKIKKNIELQITLVGGEIDSELKELCKDFHPDIVVMGTGGTGKTINRWGRVSTYIINHSRVPVLTVPEIKIFRGFDKIMLAADPSGKEVEDLIHKIMLMFSDFSFQLYCIHFLIRENEAEENKKMESLRKKFEKEEKSGLISFKIIKVTEDKHAVINQVIENQSIDMIAFQPHKHNLFYNLFTRKITKKDLQVTNVPLLVLPLC